MVKLFQKLVGAGDIAGRCPQTAKLYQRHSATAVAASARALEPRDLLKKVDQNFKLTASSRIDKLLFMAKTKRVEFSLNPLILF
ncbi:MAG: hypothetical protein IKJ91_00750 [Clostridia bacterium]|nr:hypothetical protein [Clostridia bacterium]